MCESLSSEKTSRRHTQHIANRDSAGCTSSASARPQRSCSERSGEKKPTRNFRLSFSITPGTQGLPSGPRVTGRPRVCPPQTSCTTAGKRLITFCSLAPLMPTGSISIMRANHCLDSVPFTSAITVPSAFVMV